jgi:hypothetical protein
MQQAATRAVDAKTRKFGGSYRIERSGSHAWGIRVRAAIKEPWDRILMDLVLWAGGAE